MGPQKQDKARGDSTALGENQPTANSVSSRIDTENSELDLEKAHHLIKKLFFFEIIIFFSD